MPNQIMENTEVWRDVLGYEGRYQVSNRGRVRSLYSWSVKDRTYIPDVRMLKPQDNGNGYEIVGLTKCGVRKQKYVHRLVAMAFVENPNGYKYINHLDFGKKNNEANNLEWCIQKHNVNYSSGNMRHRHRSTTNSGEQYITTRRGRYRITIDKKEYPSKLTLSEAVQFRDAILKGVIE